VMITKDKFAHSRADNASLAFKAAAPNIVDDNCMREGMVLGRSTAFITAVMCEMLRAYTVKSSRPAYETFFRNRVMHLACGISFFCTVALTFIPGVKKIFKLDTPALFFYFIAFVFAFGCMLNDEIFKFFYRKRNAHRKMTQEAGAKQSEAAEQLDMIADMLHNLEVGRAKMDADVYDIKESLGVLLTNRKQVAPVAPRGVGDAHTDSVLLELAAGA